VLSELAPSNAGGATLAREGGASADRRAASNDHGRAARGAGAARVAGGRSVRARPAAGAARARAGARLLAGRGVRGAPDYAGPLCGWRAWLLAEAEAGLLLRSVVYETLWRPRQPLRAECLDSARRGGHRAPVEACRCGIYAVCEPERALAFLGSAGRFMRRTRPSQYVFGRVFLWGEVVECWAGWRAERAYPAHLYLPNDSEQPSVDTVRALARYQVPVEPLQVRSRRELLAALEPARAAADRPRV